jgi:hypothetical protein
MDWDYTLPWYHGTQQELMVIRAGSSISQNRDVARIFSHRPTLVSTADDGTRKHNGTLPGYLYVVAEAIGAEDVYPHPHPVNVGYWEWLTKRDLRLTLLERTTVRPEEFLSNGEIAELQRRQAAAGAATFAQ